LSPRFILLEHWEKSPVENHEDRQRIAEFLQEQKALQRNLLGSLRKDPYLRSACSDRAIEYNQKLLAASNQLSVQLCRNPDLHSQSTMFQQLGE
jgi:hypothetical protein